MRTVFDLLLVLALYVLLRLYSRLIAYCDDGRPTKAASGPAFGVFTCHRPEPDASERRGMREPPKSSADAAPTQLRQPEGAPRG